MRNNHPSNSARNFHKDISKILLENVPDKALHAPIIGSAVGSFVKNSKIPVNAVCNTVVAWMLKYDIGPAEDNKNNAALLEELRQRISDINI